jgi:hypothetical protein
LNLLVCLQLLLFQLFYDPLNLVVFDWHKFEFLFVKLHFRQQLVIFLFIQLFILVHVLIFAFWTVVLFNNLFVTFLQLLVLLVNVLDLRQFLVGIGQFWLKFLILMGHFLILWTQCLDLRMIGFNFFLQLIDLYFGFFFILFEFIFEDVVLDHFGFVLNDIILNGR